MKVDYRKALKEESRRKILYVLQEKGNLTFKALLQESGLSRSTLSFRLKDLLKEGKIERFYNTYRITEKGIPEIYVESMIQNLGKIATHQVIKIKLNLPVELDINKEIERYSEEKPKNVSWKQLFEFLENNYPLII